MSNFGYNDWDRGFYWENNSLIKISRNAVAVRWERVGVYFSSPRLGGFAD